MILIAHAHLGRAGDHFNLGSGCFDTHSALSQSRRGENFGNRPVGTSVLIVPYEFTAVCITNHETAIKIRLYTQHSSRAYEYSTLAISYIFSGFL